MPLCWEIDDVSSRRVEVQIRFAQFDGAAFAAVRVVIKHVWKLLLEFQSYTFPHYANTVDRIDQGLRLALEHIAD